MYGGSTAVAEAAKQGPARDKSKVQSERAMVFVREAWVRAIDMQHLEQAVHIVLSIAGPFVPAARQEAALRQPGAAVLA